jgi:uncharacterized protein YecE (DUF72 family)
MNEIRFGTCSWKYDSWRGILYPEAGRFNYLEEYSRHYNTVEIDQWFWSLFDKVVLPQSPVVNNYAASVPDDFLFTIKVPNSLTLTHYYKTDTRNPHFLSIDLFGEFLSSIGPLINKTGSLIFQFEYLNKQKMSSAGNFIDCLSGFFERIPLNTPPISLEIRNPGFLTGNWFRFLSANNLSHVYLEGYFMPSIVQIFNKFKENISGVPLIRLHGPERSGIEELSGSDWNKIYINRDASLDPISSMIRELNEKFPLIFVNVNNHYEGCAPLTINKIKARLCV